MYMILFRINNKKSNNHYITKKQAVKIIEKFYYYTNINYKKNEIIKKYIDKDIKYITSKF